MYALHHKANNHIASSMETEKSELEALAPTRENPITYIIRKSLGLQKSVWDVSFCIIFLSAMMSPSEEA